ncbi:MAG: hypothetical protein EAX95_14755 [Candidatus Thorarchaeota archaeon]|nr:hypothetical protein [Candidatus Thorarchaeota archaeon]
MTRYHGTGTVSWPYSCVGCGSKDSLIDYRFGWGSTAVHDNIIATLDTMVGVHLCPECYGTARGRINAGRVKYSKAARASRKLIIPLLLIWFLVPFASIQLWMRFSEGPIGPLPFPWDYILFLPMLTAPFAIMGMITVALVLTILRGIHGRLEANPYYIYMELAQHGISLNITLKSQKYYEELKSLNPSINAEHDSDYEWSIVTDFLMNQFAWYSILLPIGVGCIAMLLFLPGSLVPWLIPTGYFASISLLTLLSFKAPDWIASPDIEAEVGTPRRSVQTDELFEREAFVAPNSPIRAACPTCRTQAVFHPTEFLPNGKVKCKNCLGLFKPEVLPS